jgi:hypothetical protein
MDTRIALSILLAVFIVTSGAYIVTGQDDSLDNSAYFHDHGGKKNALLSIYSEDRQFVREQASDPRSQELEVLTSDGAHIRPRDLGDFAKCPKLKHITVGCSKIEREDIQVLAKFPKLESFVVVADFSVFGYYPTQYAEISEDAFQELLALHLKDIWLESPMTEQRMKAFGDCDSLEELSLKCNKNHGDIWKSFRSPKNLRKLQIFATPLSPDSLAPLIHHEKLEELMIDTNDWQSEPWEEIAKIPNLEYLSIGGSGLSGKGIGSLAKLTKLRTLRIEAPDFSEEGVRELLKCRQLEYIHAMDAPVSDELADEFLKMPNLHKLYFGLGLISKASASKISDEMERRRVAKGIK